MESFEKLGPWSQKGVTVLYPGGFKPLTGGHLSLIRKYAELSEVNEVRLLVGPGIRNGINQETAVQIASKFLEGVPKVTVEASKYPSPILTAYKTVESAEPGKYTLASSSKGNDWERTAAFIEQHQPGGKYYEKLPAGVEIVPLPVDPDPAIYSGRTDELEGGPISASVLRKDIMTDDMENFSTNYPDEDEDSISYVWNLLHGTLTEEMSLEDGDHIYEGDLTGNVNKHMTHAEDLILMGGKEGVEWVIDMMTSLYDKLKGFTPKNEIRLSVKIDGAPAIFAWSSFPGMGSAGIATKGLFAKDSKILLSEDDIERHYGDKPQLDYKLKSFLKNLSDIHIPSGEIWQGDFLFDNKSIQEVEIEGEEYYSFHPNTIYYVVPKSSSLGMDIKTADVGVVWHTRYTGSDLQNVEARYDIDVNELQSTPKVFMTDPYIKSLAGKINFTEEETHDIEEDMESMLEISNEIFSGAENYSHFIGNEELISLFSIYWNSLIRDNISVNDEDVKDSFIEFIHNRFLKEEDKRKTEKGKSQVREKSEALILFVDDNKEIMELIVIFMGLVSKLKGKFIVKLNNIGNFQTYLKMKSGETRKTGQEGFAASDINGNVVKLVDRREFSWSNFSPDVIKGWS